MAKKRNKTPIQSIALTGKPDRRSKYTKDFITKLIIIGIAGIIGGLVVSYLLSVGNEVDLAELTPITVFAGIFKGEITGKNLEAGLLIGLIGAFFGMAGAYTKYEKFKNLRLGEEHGSAKLLTSSDMPRFNQQFFWDPAICKKYDKHPEKKGYTYYDKENLKKVCKQLHHSLEAYKECFANSQILGQDVYISMNTKFINRNLNSITIGGSGQGKSYSELFPNALNANCNYIFTDPSGEIYAKVGYFLEVQGYELRVFNVDELALSMKYNPLVYIETEKDYNILVDALNKNIKPDKKSGGNNEFFDDAKDSLVCALIALLKELYPARVLTDEEEEIVKWFRTYKKEFEEVIDNEPESEIVAEYIKLKNKADKELKDAEEELKKKPTDKVLLSTYRLKADEVSHGYPGVLTSIYNKTHKDKHDENEVRGLVVNSDNLCKQTLSNVMELLRMAKQDADKDGNATSTLDEMFSKLRQVNRRSYAAKMWSNFVVGGPKVCNEVIISAAAVFGRYFDTDDITWLTMADELKLRDLASEKKVALFLVIPQDTKTYNFMVSMIYSQLFSIATKAGKKWRDDHNLENPALPRHLSFWLDEFANCGKIPSFNELLSVVRKYNISVNIIIQGMAQLKAMYPREEWEIIFANLDEMIYLGGMEPSTVKWLSEKLGKETIRSLSNGYQSNKSGSLNTQSMARSLLTTDEIEQMSRSNELLFISGCKPIQTRKYDLSSHPNFQYCGEADPKYNLNINERFKDNKIDYEMLDISIITEEDVKGFNFNTLVLKEGHKRGVIKPKDNTDETKQDDNAQSKNAESGITTAQNAIQKIVNDNTLTAEEKERRIKEIKNADKHLKQAINDDFIVRYDLLNADVYEGFVPDYEFHEEDFDYDTLNLDMEGFDLSDDTVAESESVAEEDIIQPEGYEQPFDAQTGEIIEADDDITEDEIANILLKQSDDDEDSAKKANTASGGGKSIDVTTPDFSVSDLW